MYLVRWSDIQRPRYLVVCRSANNLDEQCLFEPGTTLKWLRHMSSTRTSLKLFSASINAYTASQNVLNGTYATTGSNIFKGNQVISGSLSVSGSTNIFGTTNITGSVNVSGSTGTAITANIDTIVFTGLSVS